VAWNGTWKEYIGEGAKGRKGDGGNGLAAGEKI